MSPYFSAVADHIAESEKIDEALFKVFNFIFLYPILMLGLGPFIVAVLKYRIDRDPHEYFDIWECIWRIFLLAAVAFGLYWMLSFGDIRSRGRSFLKVLCFTMALQMTLVLLITSSIKVDFSWFYSGIADAPIITFDPILPSLLMFEYLVLNLLILILPAIQFKSIYRKELRRGTLIALDAAKMPATWHCVREAIGRMNAMVESELLTANREWHEWQSQNLLREEHVCALLVRTSGSTPGVIQEGLDVLLLIPRGFILLANSANDVATAMLAHEFAHVLQQDCDLWERSIVWRKAHLHYSLPVLIIGILSFIGVWVVFGFPGWHSTAMIILILLGVTVWLGNAHLGLREARVRSEYLADWAAALALGEDSIVEAVRRFGCHGTDQAEKDYREAALKRVLRPQEA